MDYRIERVVPMKLKWKVLMCLTILALSVVTVSAYSPQIGDIIGKVLYTDIVTILDGREIPSVNIGGRTAIIVEDLSDYGYDVTWNGETRILEAKSKTEVGSDSIETITGMVMLQEGQVAPKGGVEVDITSRLGIEYLPEGTTGVPAFSEVSTKVMIYEGNNFATYSIHFSEYLEPIQLEMRTEYKDKTYFETVDVSESNKSNIDFILDINF